MAMLIYDQCLMLVVMMAPIVHEMSRWYHGDGDTYTHLDM